MPTHVKAPGVVAVAREETVGTDFYAGRVDEVVVRAAVPAVGVGAHGRWMGVCVCVCVDSADWVGVYATWYVLVEVCGVLMDQRWVCMSLVLCVCVCVRVCRGTQRQSECMCVCAMYV